jgi:octaprenyl-diphosphate synthase
MNSEYARRLAGIEAVLSAFLPEDPDGSWVDRIFPGLPLPVPPALAKSLTLPGWDLVSRGGKRWRPLLTVLICEALDGGDAALPLVPLVELPHNASLIHDDIEDNSDERRGKAAAHILYGTDTAINSGCFLYFLPLGCIDGWDAPLELKGQVHRLWGECMRRLGLGQAMDIAWHRSGQEVSGLSSPPGLPDYDLMCRLKTGSLARLAAILGVYGAAAAGSIGPGDTGALAETLGGAAEKLGVGFQILDDVTNLTTGNPGKKRGDDIVEGKLSLPALLYLHGHGGDPPPDALALASRCFAAARAGGVGAPEVEELIAALEGSGALEEARERGLALIGEARESLTAVGSGGLIAGLIDSIS